MSRASNTDARLSSFICLTAVKIAAFHLTLWIYFGFPEVSSHVVVVCAGGGVFQRAVVCKGGGLCALQGCSPTLLSLKHSQRFLGWGSLLARVHLSSAQCLYHSWATDLTPQFATYTPSGWSEHWCVTPRLQQLGQVAVSTLVSWLGELETEAKFQPHLASG